MADSIGARDSAQPTSRRWTLILMAAAIALYWASMYFYVPTLPIYAQEKIQDLAKVGLVVSMYGLWQALVRFPLGILSDWVGKRKPFILVGFVMVALGAYVMGTAKGYSDLLIGRAITGIAAASWVPMTVLFSSLFPPQEAVRATSILSLVNVVSRMLATGINGSLNRVGGYPLAFFVSVGVAGLAILTLLPIRERPRSPVLPSARRIGQLITRREVLVPALFSTLLQYLIWSTTFGFLPILAKTYGASGEMNSLLVSLNLGVNMIGNLLITLLVKRTGNRPLLYTGFGVMLAGVGLLAVGQSLAAVFIAQMLIGFGDGLAAPLCMGMSIQKGEDTERATAMGLHQAVYAIGMFAGPWLSGLLADQFGVPWMFGGTVALVLALVVLLSFFLPRD